MLGDRCWVCGDGLTLKRQSIVGGCRNKEVGDGLKSGRKAGWLLKKDGLNKKRYDRDVSNKVLNNNLCF